MKDKKMDSKDLYLKDLQSELIGLQAREQIIAHRKREVMSLLQMIKMHEISEVM